MKLVFTNSVLANCLIAKEENHKRLKTKEKDRNNTVLHRTPPPATVNPVPRMKWCDTL